MNARLRCAIYTRKSTEEGLDQDYNSLEAQRDACVAYVKSQAGEGWAVVKTPYNDGGLSGATMERPALKQLLSDIEARKVDVVVVYKVDRLTRSLADFAKIVEILDAHDVSFVSVTQQFNTTSSMGRLTLNVLLSFAQFEREVTAERIRDKIAASKKKGLWMGGVVPLGYDVIDRKLVVNPEEAATVRTLFDLYDRLGTVKAVKEEADRLDLRTKNRTPNNGNRGGGVPFQVGHLHKLLTNCLYVGEMGHKGRRYPGEHDPLIERSLWDAVQARLAKNAVTRRSGTNTASTNLLAGLLHDENGDTLKVLHASKSSRRYRYYISRPRQDGSAQASPGWRLPALAIEGLVVQSVGTLLDDTIRLTGTLGLTDVTARDSKSMMAQTSQLKRQLDTGSRRELRALLLDIVGRIELRGNCVRIGINARALRGHLGVPDVSGSPRQRITWLEVPVQLRRRGAELKLVIAGDQASAGEADPKLIAAVAQGHRWFEELRSGASRSVAELVRRHGIHQADVSRALPLAFLAPDIVEAILDGRHPVELTAAHLKRIRLPHAWVDQRRVLGFKA